jgi:hypothetical protein
MLIIQAGLKSPLSRKGLNPPDLLITLSNDNGLGLDFLENKASLAWHKYPGSLFSLHRTCSRFNRPYPSLNFPHTQTYKFLISLF